MKDHPNPYAREMIAELSEPVDWTDKKDGYQVEIGIVQITLWPPGPAMEQWHYLAWPLDVGGYADALDEAIGKVRAEVSQELRKYLQIFEEEA